MISSTPQILDQLPAYESLGLITKTDGLEQFDHLRAYRELGPIYQLQFRGERWVAIAGLEANEVAWRNPDAWNYEDALVPFREVMGPSHVTQLDREPHRRKRRNLKNGFAMSAIARQIPEIDRTVAEELGKHTDQPLNLHDFFMKTLTVANSRTVIQCELDAAAVDIFIKFEEEFIKGTSMGEARHHHYQKPEFVKNREFVFGFLDALVTRRLAGERVGDNFQEMIDDRRERGEPLDKSELIPEAYLLLMAGTGNTAKMLNCGLQKLTERPDWLLRLNEEIATYEPESLLRGMSSFPLLKATLMEMERLFPTAAVLSRVVYEPFVFADYELPKGTKVLHLQTIPHFLEEIYEDPYQFLPERWLDREYSRKAMGTFGGSTHICLGINLVRIHMPVVVANLLRNYVLQLPQQTGISINLNYGVPQVANLEATFLRRESSTAAVQS